MGRSIIAQGKSLQEAIETGLNLLGTTRNNVDIEIIEQEKKGVFGFGTKPAVVKLVERREDLLADQQDQSGSRKTDWLDTIDFDEMLDPSNDVKASSDQTINNQDHPKIPKQEADKAGMVWIEEGLIYCKDSLNHYPTITPCKEALFYKNDELVRTTTTVTEKDRLRVELESESKDTVWEIKLDKSKLKATIHLHPGYLKEKKLINQNPDKHINLDVITDTTSKNDLQISHVLEKLKEKEVIEGIDYSQITKACETLESGTFVIAAGTESVPGKNGWLEKLVDIEGQTPQPKERVDGSINFREIRHIPSIDQGQVIAIIHPPIPGKTGVTVIGDTIPPAPGRELIVRSGKGVELVEENTKIVATESGRPQIEQRGILIKASIMQKLVHSQDVDLSTGNIHFIGDVEVGGNVQEDMDVQAEGDIFIQHNVNMATITAGDSIIVNKNVIGSTLTAGKSNMLIADMSQLLGEIVEQMKHLIQAVEQLFRTPAFKMTDTSKTGLSSLINIMMEKKFYSFAFLVKQLVEKADEGKYVLDEEWTELAATLRKCFLLIHPEGLKGIEDLVHLQSRVAQFHEISMVPPDPDSIITIPYALNSRIYCSGEISIVGHGCYNTKIHAGGAVQVQGFIRGGEIYAGMGANISEAGAKGGVLTKIVVPRDQIIKIKIALEDTVVQVGKKTHKFTEETRNIRARLDDEGQLLLH